MSRIVQVANFVAPHSGGIRTVLDHLAAGYAAAGHEVVQVVPGRRVETIRTPWGRRLVLTGVPLPRTGYRVLRFGCVVQTIGDLEPDRLEVHDRSTLRGLGRWAARRGSRALVISHERLDRLAAQWLPDVPAVRRLADRSNAALAAGFDSVVCTTEWAAAEFRRLSVPNLRVVPLGVDVGHFQPGVDERLRAEFAADGTALLVLTSRMSREKRPELAVRTVAELGRRRAPVSLVVAGDGPMRGRVGRLARGLPVILAGHLASDLVARLLATADVVLAPGPVETFGLAALEALASGTPVVCNENSALPDVLGATGGIAAAATPHAFADAVQELLSRPGAERRAAARARAKCYDWARTVAGFLEAHQLTDDSVRMP